MTSMIVFIIVGTGATLAIRKILRDKKQGKSLSCGGDCSRCRGCHR